MSFISEEERMRRSINMHLSCSPVRQSVNILNGYIMCDAYHDAKLGGSY